MTIGNWNVSHDTKDFVKATHKTIDILDSTFGSGVGILEPNKSKWPDIWRLAVKETDTSTKWNLQDGTLGGEIQWWDEDISLYFAFDISVGQAKRIVQDKNNGIWVVGRKNLILGGVKCYSIPDLRELIAQKLFVDALPNKPKTWKVG